MGTPTVGSTASAAPVSSPPAETSGTLAQATPQVFQETAGTLAHAGRINLMA